MKLGEEQKPILPQSSMNSRKNSTESGLSETNSFFKESDIELESYSVKQHLTGFLLGVFACFSAALGTASAQGLEVLLLFFSFGFVCCNSSTVKQHLTGFLTWSICMFYCSAGDGICTRLRGNASFLSVFLSFVFFSFSSLLFSVSFFQLGVFACFTAALGTASAQGLEVMLLFFSFLFSFLFFFFSSTYGLR